MHKRGASFIGLKILALSKYSPHFASKYAVLTLAAALFVVFGFVVESPQAIARGLLQIIREPAVLITDYLFVGGVGAAFVNAGLLMLVSIAMLFALKIEISGLSVASVFLMGGFALFGKNLVNIWPIILGVYLCSRLRRESFCKYVHVALLATSIAPIVTELLFCVDRPLGIRIALSTIVGMSFGLMIAPLSVNVLNLHMGFNLYNVGFAAGILGTVYVSVFKSYGYTAYTRLVVSTGNNGLLGAFLLALFALMILTGFALDPRAPKKLLALWKQPGVFGTDFIELGGFGPAIINMGLNGLAAMGYVLLVGGELNGPTVGGILTVSGFGAFGKHLKNIVPIFIGVFIASLSKMWNINDPAILIAALFGTSLAPIAGRFGWMWGIAAGFINSSVVLNSGILHGGMNLYNTGFSAGIVAAVMVPLLNTFRKKEEQAGS
jgi:hypothetical protein